MELFSRNKLWLRFPARRVGWGSLGHLEGNLDMDSYSLPVSCVGRVCDLPFCSGVTWGI